jgi:hypothetical protein
MVTFANGAAYLAIACEVMGTVTLRFMDPSDASIDVSQALALTFAANDALEPVAGYGFITSTFHGLGAATLCESSSTAYVVQALVQSLRSTFQLANGQIVVPQDSIACSPVARRAALTHALTFNLRVEVPLSELAALLDFLAAWPLVADATGLAALLSTYPRTSSLVLEVVAPGTEPVVYIPGVDCVAGQQWSAWTACSPSCGVLVTSTRTRTRVCPPNASDVEVCVVQPCAACAVNNGGCDAVATCTSDAGTGVRMCTCPPAQYFGDGITCVARTAAQMQYLNGYLAYPYNLSLFAPTDELGAQLLAELHLKLAVELNLTDSRFATIAAQDTLYADTPTSFRFVFSIEPPVESSDRTAAELKVLFEAALAAGYFDLFLNDDNATRISPTASASVQDAPQAQSASSDGTPWNDTDTTFLVVGCAIAVALVLFIFGLVICLRGRAGGNSVRTRVLFDKGGVPLPAQGWDTDVHRASVSHLRGDGWWDNSSDTIAPGEKKIGRHFYPQAAVPGAGSLMALN